MKKLFVSLLLSALITVPVMASNIEEYAAKLGMSMEEVEELEYTEEELLYLLSLEEDFDADLEEDLEENAEDTSDLASMSIDELLELRSEINKKLNELGYSEGELIGSGTYYVGTNIDPGLYNITCDYESYFVDILVFANEEMYQGFCEADTNTNGEFRDAAGKFAKNYTYIDNNDVATVSLADGEILYASGGNGHISVSESTILK